MLQHKIALPDLHLVHIMQGLHWQHRLEILRSDLVSGNDYLFLFGTSSAFYLLLYCNTGTHVNYHKFFKNIILNLI